MSTRTVTPLTFFQVSEKAETTLALGIEFHCSFRLITDFQGPISGPTFNLKGDWVYIPFREEDREIIPKAAYQIHRRLKKAGCHDLQVIIGHEVRESPEALPILPQFTPEVVSPRFPAVTPIAKPEIDLGKVALAAGGLLAGMVGIAAVSIGALLGSLLLYDSSYCICLDDEFGTVVELLSWSTEA